jgi:hypothetical protein
VSPRVPLRAHRPACLGEDGRRGRCSLVSCRSGFRTAAKRPAKGPKARVVVQQVFRPEGLYGTEGTVSAVVIERDGAPVARRQVVSPGVAEPHTLLDERLEPGSYRVRSYQRTCSASCPSSSSDPAHAPRPDPPSARCFAPVEMIDDQVVEVLITVDPTRAICEIETGIAQTRPE